MNKQIVIALIVMVLLSAYPVFAGNISPGVTDVVGEETPTPTPIPTPAPSSGGSGGSSSGGLGVSSDEPFSNVNSYCRAEKDLTPTGKYTFDCTFYEVNVKDSIREYDVMMCVEDLKGISKNTPIQPEGEVYKFINAFIGTKRLESAELKFKVPVSWASGKNVQLLIWRNGIWNVMETTKISEDSVYVYFSAKTDHFTNFAIVGKVVQITPVQTTTPIQIIQPTPTITEPIIQPTIPIEPQESGYNSIIILIVGLCFIILAYFLYTTLKK